MVLIVDDDGGIRQALARLLQQHGFPVTVAASLAEARAAAHQQRVDAVILDLGLGAESGLDLLIWLRAQPGHATTPVLILTGTTTLTQDEEARIRENSAYVFYKPQSLLALVEYVRRLTGSSETPS